MFLFFVFFFILSFFIKNSGLHRKERVVVVKSCNEGWRSRKNVQKEAMNGIIMPRENPQTIVWAWIHRARLLQIQIPGLSYERKTSQVLLPLWIYLRSWRQPLARWCVFASSHGHHFFPTGLLHGHHVFSQTPAVCQSAAQSPCAWTRGTGPLNAWGGQEVAPSERLFPLRLWLPILSDTVHLELEKQGCLLCVPISLSYIKQHGMRFMFCFNKVQTLKYSRVLREKNMTYFYACLNSTVFTKNTHSAHGE
jgi:hypothetical protein